MKRSVLTIALETILLFFFRLKILLLQSLECCDERNAQLCQAQTPGSDARLCFPGHCPREVDGNAFFVTMWPVLAVTQS